jgi:hypothetical protein
LARSEAPRCEKAAEIGACRQQNQCGQQHQPTDKGLGRTAQGVAHEPRMGQEELQAVVVTGIGL